MARRTIRTARGYSDLDVNEAAAGADGVSANDQPLQDLMGIALQDRAVHVGPGVALVGIADDDLLVSAGPAGQVPLGPGGKTGAAPSPQPRLLDFRDDARRGALQGRGQGAVPAFGQVIVNVLRIDAAALFHDDPFFPVEARKLHDGRDQVVGDGGAEDVFQPRITALQKELGQHRGFAGVDLGIKNRRKARGRVVDHDYRLGVTVPAAAHEVDAGLDAPLRQRPFEGRPGFERPGGDAAGGHADVDFRYRRRVKYRPAPESLGPQRLKRSIGYVTRGWSHFFVRRGP